MSVEGQTLQDGQLLKTDHSMNNHEFAHDSHVVTGGQIAASSDSDNLTYDWETSETLHIVKTFPISDYGTKSDDESLSGFLVPEPPSLSGIIDTTIDKSSSSETTDVEEKYVEDDMSSLTNITDVEVSKAPPNHEFVKERIEREGNAYDKLYNACLKGQITIAKDILENYQTTSTSLSDEHGQTPLYAACIGNHPEIINLLVDFGYDVNHQDKEGKTPLHVSFENHEPGVAKTLMTQLNADTKIRDIHNWTPLHTAIDRGYNLYSQQLSQQKFLQEDVDTEVSWIQLHAACFQENTQDVQTLLEAETDVNHASSAGHTPLHIAVAKNNISLVTLLLNHNADVNSVNCDQQTPLHVAVDKVEETIMQKLLSKKADFTLKDLAGNTCLHLAVHIKDTKPGFIKAGASIIDHWSSVPPSYQPCNRQTVQAIIEHGADVNAVNNKGQTALWFACCDGRIDLVKNLLDKGADPNIADKNGESCLHAAIYGMCNSETIQGLIDHGSNVNAINKDGASPLLLACSAAQTDSVKLLLKAKADPNIAYADGDSSLHTAISADCEKETLQELIDSGGHVNSLNARGRTALLFGCLYRQTDSVMALLEAGADPAIDDDESFSCIHAAVDGRCSTETLQALIDHGAYIDAKRKDGTNALLRACTTGQSGSVKFLLEAGAEVNVVKPNGNTCLHEAVCGECSNESLHTIIAQGTDVNAVNNRGESALLLACTLAQAESAKLLMDEGADPDIFTVDGYTSLHVVIYFCWSHEILQEMMRHKPHLEAQNKDGHTALFLACYYGQQTSIRILLEAASNPNIASTSGNTSLHAAVLGKCNKKIIQLIIDHFADLNATNNRHETALMLSCIKANEDTINVLLKAKADATIAEADGNTCLHIAITQNLNIEVIQELIRRGGDVNAVNNNCVSALGMACQMGQIDTIGLLIKLGADINITDPDGNTYLHCGVQEDYSKEVIQAILDHGVNVNTSNKTNETALMMSIRKINRNNINMLLKAGADPNIANTDGDTCLHLAVIKGCCKEILQAIVDHGANVDERNKSDETALMISIRKGNKSNVNVLLNAGANPDIVDTNGNTCLHYAAHNVCPKVFLQAIIDQGVNVNATNQENETALLEACMYGQDFKIRVLLDAEADPNIPNKNGNTCLHYAADDDCPKEVLQAIIDKGADVNATNQENETALLAACMYGQDFKIRVLLDAEADPNIPNKNGNTCLHYAVDDDCPKEVLQAIIDKGADVNATNQENETALLAACMYGQDFKIRVLLDAEADPNIANKNDYTCLHFSVLGNCSKEVIQTIIGQGADVNAKNQESQTALLLACEKGNTDIVNILLSAGADPNIADMDGNICLHHAVNKYCTKNLLQALINQGVNVNATNQKNQTALLRACINVENVKISKLLGAGADPTIADEDSNTCLHFSVLGNCSKEVIQAIVDHGADVNATNNKNHTPFMSACRQRNVVALDVFLNANKHHNWVRFVYWKKKKRKKNARADPNIVDTDGNTCLHDAVFGNCGKQVIQAIINHNADVNAINQDSQTAIIVACKTGNIHAMNVLLTAGTNPNMADVDGNTCLHHAVLGNCNKEDIQTTVDHGANVNATKQ